MDELKQLDFQILFESAPGLYLVLTPELRIVAVSNQYLKATMTKRQDILGHALFEIFPDNPDDTSATGVNNLRASLQRVLTQRTADAMAIQKYDIRRPESAGGGFEERYWSPLNSPVFNADNEIVYIIHRVEDVTEFIHLKEKGVAQLKLTDELRLHAEDMEREIYRRGQEIQEAKANFASIVEKNTDGILVLDQQGAVRYANPVALSQLNCTREKLLNKPFHISVMPGGERKEIEILRPNGARGAGDFWAMPTEWGGSQALLVSIRDVTETKNLETQFRQAQKMEAVGRLAGGIAHDFNNHLAVITMTTELIMSSASDLSDDFKKDILEIKRAGERAAGLTKQLLAFSRQQVLQPTVLNLNNIVVEMDRMLKRLIGEDIELITRLDAELGHVKADAGQIEQVIMNLVVNARDAMSTRGRLTIETDNVELDETYAHQHYVVRPGPYVMLAVSDNGHGMDVATQEKIFEPFFTTKEKDKGTGLGLSTVYGIVKQSGGYVWVYSELLRGTAIKIYLPRVDAEARPVSVISMSSKTLLGSETILVVEDEEAVRRLVCRVLSECGYKVIEASGGNEALALASKHNGNIDLLVTDVIMPNLDGNEVATRITALYPKLKILYLSGYTRHSIGKNNELDPTIGFLQKPFAQGALIAKVRQLLD